MKKIILIAGFICFSLFTFGQSFNTGEILKPGSFSAGINPLNVEKSLALYLHGGYGVTKRIDIAVRYGFFDGKDYLGADVEWLLKQSREYNISLVTGAHKTYNSGLDLGVVLSIPVGKHATIISGLDSDIEFDKNDNRHFWIPLGVELNWKKQASIIIEADIPVSDWAPHIIGGGLMFYFQ